MLYRGFSYRKDGKSKDGIKQYWRCILRDGCKGRAHTTGLDDKLLVVFTNEQHEHLPSEELTTKSTMKARLCEMARADPLKSLKQVNKDFITEELPREAAEDVLLPTFTGCKSQMHRSRQEDLPRLLQSAAEVQLAGEYAQTSTGDNFVLQLTDQRLIVATDENLRVMAKCETLY